MNRKSPGLPDVNLDRVRHFLLELLDIPSPSGFTDEVVRYTCNQLDRIGIPYEITRRGAIRADLKGKVYSPDRAIVAHLDTIGAMVAGLKENGRLAVSPVGTWSARFAEGARVTVFSDHRPYRGTILPLKASGHIYNEEIDELPIHWDNLELRVDEVCHNAAELRGLGLEVGDFVAVDASPDISDSGFINARHLDDKAGVAVLLVLAETIVEHNMELPVDCHLLFTISEEVGSGASAVLHGDVAEMVTIDTGPSAPGHSTDEYGVTICMKDSSGPFDYHLTRRLIDLCKAGEIQYRRDIYTNYRCDSASAVEAGNDIRTALVCFGTDASHGYERCHERTLRALGRLLLAYMNSKALFRRDRKELGDIEGFPSLPLEEQEEER